MPRIYQCEYVGADRVRCTARVGLEIDHVEPYGKGGSSEEENLRVLCRPHNVYAAEREFGEEFVRGKIEARRASSPAAVASGSCRVSPVVWAELRGLPGGESGLLGQ